MGEWDSCSGYNSPEDLKPTVMKRISLPLSGPSFFSAGSPSSKRRLAGRRSTLTCSRNYNNVADIGG